VGVVAVELVGVVALVVAGVVVEAEALGPGAGALVAVV
jgi:hypothetical protein